MVLSSARRSGVMAYALSVLRSIPDCWCPSDGFTSGPTARSSRPNTVAAFGAEAERGTEQRWRRKRKGKAQGLPSLIAGSGPLRVSANRPGQMRPICAAAVLMGLRPVCDSRESPVLMVWPAMALISHLYLSFGIDHRPAVSQCLGRKPRASLVRSRVASATAFARSRPCWSTRSSSAGSAFRLA